MEEPEILIVKISMEKVIDYEFEFDKRLFHWLLQKMIHYGLPLFLIYHPEEIHAFLQGAKPVGLEVNVPPDIFQDVYPGKNNKRVDLIFLKQDIDSYFLVEVKSSKPTTKDKEQLREYWKRFLEFAESTKRQVFPIMVYPDTQPDQALLSWQSKRRLS